MAREVTVGSRRFYVVSEPHAVLGWRAKVLEVLDESGVTREVGIETTGDTRGMADERAVAAVLSRFRDR